MPDKRIAQRRLVGYRAHLKLNDSGTLVECVVRDISQTGARLIVTSPSELPDTFSLFLSKDVARRCRIVWRKEKQVGVNFGGRQMQQEPGWIKMIEPKKNVVAAPLKTPEA